MRKLLRFLLALAGMLWTGFLALMLVMLRYMLRTPQPLQSVLSGEAHLYKWTRGHIYYHIQGAHDAPAVVLLHAPGIAASSYTMRSLMDGLATHYRVYVPDLLGFGLSDHPSLLYSADMYVELCRDFLKEVVGRPATLIATGISCNYSIAVAVQEPGLCERLVLLSPISLLKKRSQAPWFAPVITTPIVALALYALLTRAPLLRRVIARQYGWQPQDIKSEQMAHYIAVAHQFGAEHAPIVWLTGALDIDVLPLLGRLQQPMLLLWGVHALNDRITVLNQLSLPAQAQLVLVHNAGLSVHEEQPETVIANIHTWLASAPQPAISVAQVAQAAQNKSATSTSVPPYPTSPTTTSVPPQLERNEERQLHQQTEIEAVETPTETVQTPTETEAIEQNGESGQAEEAEAMAIPASSQTGTKMEAYCVKCKQKRPMLRPKEVVTKNGRRALEDTCPVCGRKLFRFVASQEE
jgi:pimeloyl-ACP methyl ester carboxylesterase